MGEALTVVTKLNLLFHSAEVKISCQSQKDRVLTLCCLAAATVTGITGWPCKIQPLRVIIYRGNKYVSF